MDTKLKKEIKEMPVKQQVGLYVILDNFINKELLFKSSDFQREMKKYLILDDEDGYRRVIGGILSGLSKNNLITRMSNDKDPLWNISIDVAEDADDYKQAILPVITYWTS